MEPECYAMAPLGVSFHTARIPLHEVSVEALRRLGEAGLEDVLGAVRLLATAPLHSIVFACTSGSFIGGKTYDERLIAAMQQACPGIPVTTTSTALVAGLGAVGARRVVVAAPYPHEITARAADYLRERGFTVAATSSLNLTSDHDIGFTPPSVVVEQVLALDRPEADAVVICCTNLRTAAILEDLEARLGKPVVSAIQASVWHALRLAGIADPVLGYGRLLTVSSPAQVRA
jgi:maleate isomerase